MYMYIEELSLFLILPRPVLRDYLSYVTLLADSEWRSLNSLPNDKFLDSSKLKEFADEKSN